MDLMFSPEASKNVTSEALARQNSTKTRSLLKVNEHFEMNFNTASASAVVFKRPQ